MPILKCLNETRKNYFEASHHEQTTNKIAYWTGHKILTIVTFPLNALKTGLSALALGTSACTLGAFKIAIFAVSLGHVKLNIPTGCQWFGTEAGQGLIELGQNTYEIAYDTGHVCYQGYKLARWAAGKLQLGELFQAVFSKLKSIFLFVEERLRKGFEKAIEVEGETKCQLPACLNGLEDLTRKYRTGSTLDYRHRTFEHIFKHFALSIVNIPCNAALMTATALTADVLTIAFIAKVVLYAATNINVPIPTHANQALHVTADKLFSIGKDVSNNVVDGFVSIYKVADALKITNAVVHVVKVVEYIPEAIFG